MSEEVRGKIPDAGNKVVGQLITLLSKRDLLKRPEVTYCVVIDSFEKKLCSICYSLHGQY